MSIALTLNGNDEARYNYWYSTYTHTWYPVYIEARLPVPSLPPGDFRGTSVLGTRRNDAFGDVVNLNGPLEGPRQFA